MGDHGLCQSVSVKGCLTWKGFENHSLWTTAYNLTNHTVSPHTLDRKIDICYILKLIIQAFLLIGHPSVLGTDGTAWHAEAESGIWRIWKQRVLIYEAERSRQRRHLWWPLQLSTTRISASQIWQPLNFEWHFSLLLFDTLTSSHDMLRTFGRALDSDISLKAWDWIP